MTRISRMGGGEPVTSVLSVSSAVKHSAAAAPAYTYTRPSAQFRALGQGPRLLRFLRLLLFDSGPAGVERCTEGNDANEASKPKPLVKSAPLAGLKNSVMHPAHGLCQTIPCHKWRNKLKFQPMRRARPNRSAPGQTPLWPNTC